MGTSKEEYDAIIRESCLAGHSTVYSTSLMSFQGADHGAAHRPSEAKTASTSDASDAGTELVLPLSVPFPGYLQSKLVDEPLFLHSLSMTSCTPAQATRK